MLHKELTDQIIRAFYKVYNTLGYGFLENIFKNAMYLEMLKAGLKCETEKPINVFYDNRIIGIFYADIIVVEEKVILSLSQ